MQRRANGKVSYGKGEPKRQPHQSMLALDLTVLKSLMASEGSRSVTLGVMLDHGMIILSKKLHQ